MKISVGCKSFQCMHTYAFFFLVGFGCSIVSNKKLRKIIFEWNIFYVDWILTFQLRREIWISIFKYVCRWKLKVHRFTAHTIDSLTILIIRLMRKRNEIKNRIPNANWTFSIKLQRENYGVVSVLPKHSTQWCDAWKRVENERCICFNNSAIITLSETHSQCSHVHRWQPLTLSRTHTSVGRCWLMVCLVFVCFFFRSHLIFTLLSIAYVVSRP